tara:strand:+ start:182 stop:1189 length:1008 start_codon:yes stop_codon:yes gene_type:complete
MRVLALTDSQNPWHSFWIRFGQYIESLQQNVTVSSNPNELNYLENGDVLVLYRYDASWGNLSNKLASLRKKGVGIIADVDDYLWNTPSWSIDRKRNYTKSLNQCDRLTCSTKALEEILHWMFPKQQISVIRNNIPSLTNPRASTHYNDQETLTLCWTGAPWTRPGDLKILRPLAKWVEAHKEIPISWLHIGHVEGKVSFAEAVGMQRERVKTLPLTGYKNYLMSIRGEIGLAPLENTLFNQFKSEIKVLEYTAAGMTWIASDSDPYRELSERWGLPLRLCKTPEEWIENLIELMSPARRKEENERQVEIGESNQSFEITVNQWNQELKVSSESKI